MVRAPSCALPVNPPTNMGDHHDHKKRSSHRHSRRTGRPVNPGLTINCRRRRRIRYAACSREFRESGRASLARFPDAARFVSGAGTMNGRDSARAAGIVRPALPQRPVRARCRATRETISRVPRNHPGCLSLPDRPGPVSCTLYSLLRRRAVRTTGGTRWYRPLPGSQSVPYVCLAELADP